MRECGSANYGLVGAVLLFLKLVGAVLLICRYRNENFAKPTTIFYRCYTMTQYVVFAGSQASTQRCMN
jgi:hypothetical protein